MKEIKFKISTIIRIFDMIFDNEIFHYVSYSEAEEFIDEDILSLINSSLIDELYK